MSLSAFHMWLLTGVRRGQWNLCTKWYGKTFPGKHNFIMCSRIYKWELFKNQLKFTRHLKTDRTWKFKVIINKREALVYWALSFIQKLVLWAGSIFPFITRLLTEINWLFTVEMSTPPQIEMLQQKHAEENQYIKHAKARFTTIKKCIKSWCAGKDFG